jgi:hypothetical protein
MTNESTAANKSGDASWTPVILSVAIYPGIGQWMQKRRNAGTFYLAAFTLISLLFSWILFLYLREVIPLLRDALQGQPLDGREFPPLRELLHPFGGLLFIYFANVIDVLRGRDHLRKAAAARS